MGAHLASVPADFLLLGGLQKPRVHFLPPHVLAGLVKWAVSPSETTGADGRYQPHELLPKTVVSI